MTDNIIAVNLLAKVDEEIHRKMMISDIKDNLFLNDTMPADEGHDVTALGTKQKKQTTRGWEIMVRWKDRLSD